MSSCLKLGRAILMAAAVLLTVTSSAKASTIILDKAPDVGASWLPLSGTSTYVYANSFIFSGATGNMLDTVGVYLRSENGIAELFRFLVMADDLNAPDPGAVLGSTNTTSTTSDSLTLVTMPLISSFALTNGTRYWIAASTVGLASNGGRYQVGGHTQNSIYPDFGTFWYSNDPSGLNFDGQRLTPEMAIYATIAGAAVPEPSTLMLFGAGMALLAARLRKTTRA